MQQVDVEVEKHLCLILFCRVEHGSSTEDPEDQSESEHRRYIYIISMHEKHAHMYIIRRVVGTVVTACRLFHRDEVDTTYIFHKRERNLKAKNKCYSRTNIDLSKSLALSLILVFFVVVLVQMVHLFFSLLRINIAQK